MHLIPAFTAELLLSSVSSIARQSSGCKFNLSNVTLYISGCGFSFLTNDLLPMNSNSSFEIWPERLSNTASTLLKVVEVEKASLILLSLVIVIAWVLFRPITKKELDRYNGKDNLPMDLH